MDPIELIKSLEKRASEAEIRELALKWELDRRDVQEKHTAAIRSAAQDALDWLINAPISYTNGVSLDGIDEGDTLGIAGHNRIVEQLRAALEG